jgi:hypothetical protein
MKKISRKNITTSSVMILSMMIIASGLMLFSFNLNVIMGIPADIAKGDYLFGKTIGIVEDENGKPLWIISGNWKTNLHNQTQDGSNATVFDASFEMIKADGTSKHTHTVTNFVLADTASQNNVTTYNGTGTISMPDAAVNEVPISIKVMNKNLGILYIDPNKVDNHFGTKPIYGIPLEESEQYKKKH